MNKIPVDVDIFDLSQAAYMVHLKDMELVTMEGHIIRSPFIVCRTLSFDEASRAFNIADCVGYHRVLYEDNIANASMIKIVGYDQEIDWDASDAGCIPTITRIALVKTREQLDTFENSILEDQDVAIDEQVLTLISYYMNIPFDEVRKLSTHEINKRISNLKAVFPEKVKFERKE